MAEKSWLETTITDPNVINLLGGVAAKLDPEGFGGALGGAAVQLTKARAQQKAVGEQESARKGQNLLTLLAGMPEGPEKENLRQMAVQYLGGQGGLPMTERGKFGVTSVTKTPTGYKLDIDTEPLASPPGDVPQSTQDVAQPQQQSQTVPTTLRQPSQLSAYVPFYSAPEASRLRVLRG